MIDPGTFLKARTRKAGLAPGTLMQVGEQKEERVYVTRFDYGPEFFAESTPPTIDECLEQAEDAAVTWINIDGLHDISVIEKLGARFGLDPLSQEDILTPAQRPKLEDYGNYLLVIARMLTFDEESGRIRAEQVSIVLGERFVLSIQESRGDVFGPLRDRLRSGRGRIRKMGADYLAYVLLDCIVDNYFVLLERLGERIQELDEELSLDPRRETLQSVHELRREIIFLRKSTWPLREVANGFERSESTLVSEALSPYLRDLYDHTIQIIDIVETYQDLLQGMLDLYLSSVSNRMNEVMKVLTVFASIFIPLTFIVGIYGMNFEHMPELAWSWAYPGLLVLMFGGAVGMFLFFRHKGWML